MEEWKELCTTEVSLTKWSCNDTMHTLAKQHDYQTCIKTTVSSQVAVKTNHPPRYQLQWSINAPWHYLVVGASLLLNKSCFSHNSSIVQTAPLAPALCHTSCNQIPCSQCTTLPGQSLKYNWPCSRHWFRASLNKKNEWKPQQFLKKKKNLLDTIALFEPTKNRNATHNKPCSDQVMSLLHNRQEII